MVPHGFVEIVHLYLHAVDIWICWFGHFAFVICICRQVISPLLLDHCWILHRTTFVFSKSNHPHLRAGDVHIFRFRCWHFLTADQSGFTRPSFTFKQMNPFSLSPSLLKGGLWFEAETALKIHQARWH